MLVGVTLTDLSEEEVGIIRDNLDFSLPQEAVVHSAFDNNLQESTFRLVFSIPEECVEAMETSLVGQRLWFPSRGNATMSAR